MPVFEVVYEKSYVVYVRAKTESKIKNTISLKDIEENSVDCFETMNVYRVSEKRLESIDNDDIHSLEDFQS